VHWYNNEHRHSAIRFVTPDQRHRGDDRALLVNRAAVCERARQANPTRWSRQTRDWRFIDAVHLNPDRQQLKELEPARAAALINPSRRQLP
jgi:putative transposase